MMRWQRNWETKLIAILLAVLLWLALRLNRHAPNPAPVLPEARQQR